MFRAEKIKGITGRYEIVIEPIFKDFYTIERVRIPFTDDIDLIKENISKIFNEKIESIILV